MAPQARLEPASSWFVAEAPRLSSLKGGPKTVKFCMETGTARGPESVGAAAVPWDCRCPPRGLRFRGDKRVLEQGGTASLRARYVVTLVDLQRSLRARRVKTQRVQTTTRSLLGYPYSMCLQ